MLVYGKDGKVQLIRRTGAHGEGTWAPPGGHVDFGESVIDTAKREMKEEAGIDIGNIEILGFTEDVFEKEQKHYITIWMKGEWIVGELKTSDREFSEIGWYDMKNLPQPLFVSFKHFVEGKLLPHSSR